MPNFKYIIQLDGLRFFAIFMVLIAHWAQPKIATPFISDFPFVHGVTLFFVLSGYLISKILISNCLEYDKKQKPKKRLLKAFYIRRFLRIFPVYYLVILLLFFLDYKNTREFFPWLISYTSNIYQSIHNVYLGDFNHFWSLAVEEQFYLFWPFVILFTKPKWLPKVIISTIILSILSKWYIHMFIHNWMAASYFTISCMHALGLGALIAWISIHRESWIEKFSSAKYVWGAILCYLILVYLQHAFNLVWFTVIFDDFCFAIMASSVLMRASINGFQGPIKTILENRFIVYSGKISYGIYILHLFIPTLYKYLANMLNIPAINNYLLFICLYFLCFGIAHLSWIVFEKPINRFKIHFPYF